MGEPHVHPEYATTQDLNGIGGKVETMGKEVAVNTERTETNKVEIADLFKLHRDTEQQVGKATRAFEREVGKVSASILQIRTQIGVAVAVIIIVIEVGAKLVDKFF